MHLHQVGKISALIVIDNEGNRLMAKYYSLDVKKEESAMFEKHLFQRASKLTSKFESGGKSMMQLR